MDIVLIQSSLVTTSTMLLEDNLYFDAVARDLAERPERETKVEKERDVSNVPLSEKSVNRDPKRRPTRYVSDKYKGPIQSLNGALNYLQPNPKEPPWNQY